MEHKVPLEELVADQSVYRISMDIDPDTAETERKYPSIKDYYRANVTDKSKPMQLQKGLSNFSGLVLGDDRISFNESVLSSTYRLTVEDKMGIPSPSKTKSVDYRRNAYREAIEKVGDAELNRLERVMKDKLFQRSYMTSSPFQVNKAFKFFDRDQKLVISIEGFTRALEFLGFQFGEMQNLALFARYDPEVRGEIDYMNFIATAMFYGSSDKDNLPVPKNDKEKSDKPKDLSNEFYIVPDFSAEDLESLQRKELKRLFDKADSKKRGKIAKAQLELLLLATGNKSTPRLIDQYFAEMGLRSGDEIPFDIFCGWWNTGSLCKQWDSAEEKKQSTAAH